MNTENKPTPRRIAAATIIGTLGSGLLVATVVKLFQVTQEILPWWWPYPLIIGSILFVAALFLLVPPSWWKSIRYFLSNIPKSLRTIFWLQSVFRFNQGKIYEAIQCRLDEWDFSGLTSNALDPYFEIKLEITNTSIFTLRVIDIQGNIIVEGSTCKSAPTVNKRSGIGQGEVFLLRITQNNLPEKMLTRFKEAAQKNEKLRFDLSLVYVIFETTTESFKGRKPQIKFPAYDVIPSGKTKVWDTYFK